MRTLTTPFNIVLILAVVMALFIPSTQAQDQNVVTTLENEGFTTLVSLIDQAGLNSTLESTTLTLFAPSNEALANAPSLTQEELTALLSYHVIAGAEIPSTDLTNNQVATTLDQDKKLRVNVYSDPSAITVNGVSVTRPDISASNGVIHGINDFLTQVDQDIFTQVGSTDDVSTLATAVITADLNTTLEGAWNSSNLFTLFAPSNAAFNRLPGGALQELLNNMDDLTSVLTYHVVPGVYFSDGLKDGISVPTAQGEDVTISVSESMVMVNGANVTTADIATENGVIHIIDTVLMPESSPSESSSSSSGGDISGSSSSSSSGSNSTSSSSASISSSSDGGSNGSESESISSSSSSSSSDGGSNGGNSESSSGSSMSENDDSGSSISGSESGTSGSGRNEDNSSDVSTPSMSMIAAVAMIMVAMF